MPSLLISVHFHEGRYHGSGVWPPEPARLFQALVAGAARGRTLAPQMTAAFEWLEDLDAPVIAAPPSTAGQPFKTFVPNNDLDAVNGDPARINEVRAGKIIRPRFFDASKPVLYVWSLPPSSEAAEHAQTLCTATRDLYQLGRGVDMAWAVGEVVDDAEGRLISHGGVLRRPSRGGADEVLACPGPGSLASLSRRFQAMGERFKQQGKGRKARLAFSQAPKPEFRQIPYNSPYDFRLFDIRKGNAFLPMRLEEIVGFTENLRDGAAQRLKDSAWRKDDSKRIGCIDKIFIGREASAADKAQRIHITPLPSIGNAQAERSIRRVLVTVPPDCPISADDMAWAFSGLTIGIDGEGEVTELVPAAERNMLAHYGIEDAPPARLWRSVTPLALAERAARRRIDPARRKEEAKGGTERLQEEARAQWAVRQALRHAGISVPAVSIHVQREPFEGKGKRAEVFEAKPRFAKERLWHVEISFAEKLSGPLLIGDGRYLGLGLMAPVRRAEGLFSFAITEGLAENVEPLVLTRSLRRAVMALVQEKLGPRTKLPAFFTGHTEEGKPARSGRHEHLAFVFDPPRKRLLVIAPHSLDHRTPLVEERRQLPLLNESLEQLRELRAGAAGLLGLLPEVIDVATDPLCARSCIWESLTAYRVTRHAKADDAKAALETDLLAECQRSGLPRPHIEVTKTFAKPGLGLFGCATLHFQSAVSGPLLLGRDRHFGGGQFGAVT